MGAASWWHWAIVIAVVLILFGGKKIPELMKGVGTGIKGFKKAIKDDDEDTESSSSASTSGQTIIEASTLQPQISQKVSQATKGRTRSKSSGTKTSASRATASARATSLGDSPKKRAHPSKKA